jgi:uncharacterized protein (TIGR00156 family)
MERNTMFTTRNVLSGIGLISALSFSSLAVAQYSGPQAIVPMTSVKQILDDPKDDKLVTIQGYLTKQISKEKYMFSDGTGEIKVDIDTKKFPKESVSEATKVEISGEVDTGLFKDPTIDVERVVVVP